MSQQAERIKATVLAASFYFSLAMLAIYQQNIMLFGLILSFSTIVYATPSPRAISTCKPIASGVLTTSEKWNGNDDDSPTGA